MLSDLILFNRIKKEDIRAFESLFRKYYQRLYAYSLSILRNEDNAEEVVQQLFYTIWLNKKEMNIRGSVKSYLYQSTFNQSLQQIRQQTMLDKYQKTLNDRPEAYSFSNPHNEMEYQELNNVINSIISKQPERRRTIYKMHKEKMLKYKEIAEELSLSVKTVEAEMTKMYKDLRLGIEKYQNDYESRQ